MLTFIQHINEDKSPDVVTHHTSSIVGHHVTAYHKDADSDFHKRYTDDYYITHPKGMTARNMVGYTRFSKVGDEHQAQHTAVDASKRRQGIGTKMYDHAEKHIGKVKPSATQTPDAKKFWQSRNKDASEKWGILSH